MKIAVVCAHGVGDAVILHIASHHLKQAGHEVTTVTPHRFGRWLDSYAFGEMENCDALFLQHDNSLKAQKIRESTQTVYTFFGSYNLSKHGPLRESFDYVSDLNRSMVDNVILALKKLFSLEASSANGFIPPPHLVHRRHSKRIAIHTTSGHPSRNWPKSKFEQFAKWAKKEGFEPAFLPQFSNLEELASFLYESGYFLGNDSGPGHLASCLRVPNLIIGREEKHMRHWRPGWGGEIITPPRWVPNWKGLRIREKHWKPFITINSVINTFKNKVLRN